MLSGGRHWAAGDGDCGEKVKENAFQIPVCFTDLIVCAQNMKSQAHCRCIQQQPARGLLGGGEGMDVEYEEQAKIYTVYSKNIYSGYDTASLHH